MATPIEMPKLSEAMEEGVLVAWLVEEGDTVSAGDILAQVKTDKATMDLEALEDGVLLKKVAAEGDAVPIRELIAVLGERGEDITEILVEAGIEVDEARRMQQSAQGLSSDGGVSGSARFIDDDIDPVETGSLYPGYVYVLINSAFGMDTVKIGLTTREPSDRVRELSRSTGVPTPFTLIYKAYVPDCREIERRVHERLSAERLNPNREFFEMPPHEAVSIVNREVVRQVFGT
jgi:pyruvate/2-oxoglutarate dehydrogenase complex dihydrolipoamide acyltransferase (E2) component